MSSRVAFLFDGVNLNMVLDGHSVSVPSSHPNFKAIRQGIKDGLSARELSKLVVSNKPEAEPVVPVNIASVGGNITMDSDGTVRYKGERLHNKFVERIGQLQVQGLPFDGLFKCLQRVYENTSNRVRNELLSFIENVGLLITDDGYLLGYKAVTSDYKDKWTQKIDNRVGCTPTMDRGDVCDNCHAACGPGLHVGGLDYIYGYGSGNDHIIICKVDPANVVSVPVDSGCQKMRTCGYEVIADYQGKLVKPLYKAEESLYNNADEEDDFDWEDDDDDDNEDWDDDIKWEYNDDNVTVVDGVTNDPNLDTFNGPPAVVKTLEDDTCAVGSHGKRFHNVRNPSGQFAKKE